MDGQQGQQDEHRFEFPQGKAGGGGGKLEEKDQNRPRWDEQAKQERGGEIALEIRAHKTRAEDAARQGEDRFQGIVHEQGRAGFSHVDKDEIILK